MQSRVGAVGIKTKKIQFSKSKGDSKDIFFKEAELAVYGVPLREGAGTQPTTEACGSCAGGAGDGTLTVCLFLGYESQRPPEKPKVTAWECLRDVKYHPRPHCPTLPQAGVALQPRSCSPWPPAGQPPASPQELSGHILPHSRTPK